MPKNVAGFTGTVDSVEHPLPRLQCGVFLEWSVQAAGRRTHILGNRVDVYSGTSLWQGLQCCAKVHTRLFLEAEGTTNVFSQVF